MGGLAAEARPQHLVTTPNLLALKVGNRGLCVRDRYLDSLEHGLIQPIIKLNRDADPWTATARSPNHIRR